MIRRMLVELEALSPIAHGDTHTGIDNATNVRLFMRSASSVRGIAVQVPDVSANALRTVMLRVPLHDHLLDELAVPRGSLSRPVLNLLYSGGSVLAGAKAPTSEGSYGVRVRALYPTLGLLGGSVDAFILPRSILRVAAWPVAREYQRAIDVVAPHLSDAAASCSAFDLISEETRVRGTGAESDGNQMIYTYEVLAAGARILVELTLDHNATETHLSAVALALERWDGYFGGQGRQGRGRLRVANVQGCTVDTAPYLAHVAERRAEMLAGLLDGTFGTDRILCAA